MGADDRAVSIEVKPLTKIHGESGEVYTRPPDVTAQIREVLMLGNAEIIERTSIAGRTDPRYLKDETIVYLIRNSDRDEHGALIESLFGELSKRVACLAFSRKYVDSKGEDAEDLLGEANLFLIEKLFDESDKADFAEVRFGAFVSSFLSGKREKLRQIYNDEKVNSSLDETSASGQSFDPASTGKTIEEILADRAVLEKLPEKTYIAASLIAEGFKVESKDPAEITVSKIMNISSRTIRNWMVRAKDIMQESSGVNS